MRGSPPEQEGPSTGMASTQIETFTYKPLDRKVDSIRLLKLKEGSDTDDIECEFIHVTFASKPKYESLSYTWGSPDDPQTIRVDGCKFVVRENLYWAIRNLRRVMEQPLYWIDGICINQDDVEERNRQVSLMAFIFGRAHNVLIWLGRPATEGNIHKDTAGYPMDMVYKWLSERDYWKRVWIVQEICLARNIRCIYELGLNQTMVEDWAEMMKKLEMQVPNHAKPPLKLYRQREGRHGDSNLLERLLETFSNAKCSELRDKIYAFLGLSHDGEDGGLTVDYSKSLYELYLEVIEFHCRSEPQLDEPQLDEPQLDESLLGGPLLAGIDREMRIVAFSTLLQQIFEDGVEAEIQNIGYMKMSGHQLMTVKARALIEGRILYLGPQHSDVVSSAQASKIWKSSFRKYYNNSQNLARLREQDEAYTAVLLDMDETDLARVSKDPSPDRQIFISNHAWLSDEVPYRSDYRKWWRQRELNHDQYTNRLRFEDEFKPESALERIAEPRRFLGSNTCMGLVHPWAEVGDFICRFWGCDVAAVLRPDSDNYFIMVGRADMATSWTKKEKRPTPINTTFEFEGGGVVNITLEAHELQKLTR
jgi:hypothetical protein